MAKVSIATVWLDGCSGCHMSFLDLDERLLIVADKIDLVYSPLVDFKDYPEMVDIALVEGAVASEEDLHKIQKIRAHTKTLIAFGDCAVTANVPSMRNLVGKKAVLQHAYFELATLDPQVPNVVVPPLLDRVRPVHDVVKVDIFLPGCPPSADTIFAALVELLEGRIPDVPALTRFGK
ncbi:MAG TPA: NADP oxidoreductase [Anaerolineales bacterium]|nr:NADP oxidoreductase [Anaerolineales bacterium]HRF46728.1 NADP oxidoreductase [Anaerolineales bacterium]